MYNEPNLKAKNNFSYSGLIKRSNGTPEGLKALVSSLGRKAARENVCIFACPYEAGSEYAEVWQNAHIAETNKMVQETLNS